LPRSFAVDGFDSTRGPYAAGQTGAAVGVNGTFSATAETIQLGGSLIVTGSNPLPIDTTTPVVSGDVESAATLMMRGSSGLQIARDAWLHAGVQGAAPASITVGRDAYLGVEIRHATASISPRVEAWRSASGSSP
jgi:hypothetical protein